METIKAFYFANKNRKLRYNDNRSIVVGKTHTVSGKIKVCVNGLHASERLIDAVSYAPYSILYLVELSGEFDRGHDKLCASKREYLAEFDATEVLKEFARKQAMINIELIRSYYKGSDYEVIINFLKTGNNSKAARSALESGYSGICTAANAANAAFNAYDAASTASNAYDAAKAADAAANAADSILYALVANHSANVTHAVTFAARHAGCYNSTNLITFATNKDKANIMLTEMIKEATGWNI